MDNSFFEFNKYTKIYFQICDRARMRGKPQEYFERHHVIPKSFGGSNKRENLVALTAREHFIVHLLLVKMCNGTCRAKMVRALVRMTKFGKSSILYDTARKIISKNSKGELNPAYGRRWWTHEVTGERLFAKDAPENFTIGLKEQIGGFVSGRISINNGTETRMISPGERIPEGWSAGRHFVAPKAQLVHAASKRHTPEKDREHSEKLKGRIRIGKDGTYKCVSPDVVSKFYEDGWSNQSPPRKSRAVIIEGVQFASTREAADHLGFHVETVGQRVRTSSQRWSEWKYDVENTR